MKVGYVGLGRLGLPLALAAESCDHEVFGWDVSEERRDAIRHRRVPGHEAGLDELLDRTRVRLISVERMVRTCDLIFVAVQTPHSPEHEGTTRLPWARADFDYSFLREACHRIAGATGRPGPPVAIVSTVLPGTIRREIAPIFPDGQDLFYNPSFVAMGTAVDDFMDPEFVLVGTDGADPWPLAAFYAAIHSAEMAVMSIPSAEMTKVGYNVAVSQKIATANTVAQLCEATGGDVDDVTACLGRATRRIVSTAYTRAGMGDGGACHPRDVIALSWLARRHGVYDVFDGIMRARQGHVEWLVEMARDEQARTGLPVRVLGQAYKAETDLTAGSAALLFCALFGGDVEVWDPYVGGRFGQGPAVYVVATNHNLFAGYHFGDGSVVIDPWGYIPDGDGFKVIRPGRQR